ncbi:MAG TPA: MFS transporter [bacterium]|nr:MFS transporter [bacterium]
MTAESDHDIRLPRDIWALGMGSLFMDTSSETIHGLLPVFLVSVLGASVTSVGILEGLAEAAALVFKVISGPVSDRLPRRKPLVVLGYAMAALSKPLFALAGSVPVVYTARLFDRMGKGIRGAPRDALVADIVPPRLRGRAFGLRQSLDTVGAFLGPLLAVLLMKLTNGDYRTVFWLATIPAVLCVGTMVFGVREKTRETGWSNGRLRFRDLKKFSAAFWFVSGAGALFQLARFSEAFLILRAKDFGLSLSFAPLILIVMNIVYALSAYPFGHLSDRIPREAFLKAGLVVLCLSDAALGFAGGLVPVFCGVALWGLHLGLTQGTLSALVADTCPPEDRGTAYGLFNLFSAAALLSASAVAGVLWDRVGAKATFLTGAAFSISSLLAFLIVDMSGVKEDTRPEGSRRRKPE